MKLLVINGPNLNLLGIREPDIYGNRSYSDLVDYIETLCAKEGIEIEIFQSNHEGAIVDKIQDALNKFDGIVINPAAYTHTSIAIPDAIHAVRIPAVEVHLSDINSREPFRRHSYTSAACLKTIAGFGFDGYRIAILHLKEHLNNSDKNL
ncbi:MAG: type II 3-dehydroquinate dehydratase [Clostridiales bacterium]|nr:type II 3-dehydroquinate dehydratase [Clostridiales bacterium]